MEVPGTPPVSGSCWQDPLAVAGTTGWPVCGTRGRGSGRRALSVVFVLGREPSACPAMRSLRDACRDLRARLHTLPFGTLALGDTAALDRFYNAGEDATRSAGTGFPSPFLLLLSCPVIPALREYPGRDIPRPHGSSRRSSAGSVLRADHCLLFCLPPVYFPGWLDICRDVFLPGVKHAGVISERVVFWGGGGIAQGSSLRWGGDGQAGAPHCGLGRCDGRGHPLS